MIGKVTNIPALRQNNTNSVLRALWRRATMTRRELSEITGLTAPTVSSIVNELLSQKLISISGKADSRGGRQPDRIEFNPTAFYAAGLSLGVYRIRGVVTDLYGRPVLTREFPADYRGTDANIPQQLLRVAQDLLGSRADIRSRLLGFGVSVPGTVDPSTGIILNSPIIGEGSGISVSRSLRECFSLPVCAENNVNLCALNEYLFGRAANRGSVLFLFAGYGIGAGIVLHGEIYRGARDASGEIGHTVIEMNGRRCYCGNYGCLETVASYPALYAQLQQRMKMGAACACAELIEEPFSIEAMEKVFACARQGDRLAREVIEGVGSYLGVAAANVMNLLDPDIVIIGGDYLSVKEIIREPLLTAARLRAWKVVRDTEIEFTDFGLEADVFGAATLVIKKAIDEGLEDVIGTLPA